MKGNAALNMLAHARGAASFTKGTETDERVGNFSCELRAERGTVPPVSAGTLSNGFNALAEPVDRASMRLVSANSSSGELVPPWLPFGGHRKDVDSFVEPQR
jgi:hypothetical protein